VCLLWNYKHYQTVQYTHVCNHIQFVSTFHNTTKIYIFLIYYFLATIYMAEIDVNLYKQDEKMRNYCEKKEKRIESKQISNEVNPPKPPPKPKPAKKKDIDPIQFIRYAKAHEHELKRERNDELEFAKEQQKQFMKQMKLEKIYKENQRNDAIKNIIQEKKMKKLMQDERDKLKNSPYMSDLNNSVSSVLSYPYKSNIIKRNILEHNIQQNKLLNELITENIILDTFFKLNKGIIMPCLLYAGEIVKTEKQFPEVLMKIKQEELRLQNEQIKVKNEQKVQKTDEITVDLKQ